MENKDVSNAENIVDPAATDSGAVSGFSDLPDGCDATELSRAKESAENVKSEERGENGEDKRSARDKAKALLSLALSFLKIGLFTFGGGYAMIALLEKEFVERKKWLAHGEFLDIVAIAESTPGPIAVNCATYIGYRVGRIAGAALATAAVCLPSIVIIFCISLVFDRFLQLKYVNYAFRGIQACVVFLILSAGFKLFKKLEKTVTGMIMLSAALVCAVTLSLFAVDFSTVFYVLIGAGAGVAIYLIRLAHKKRKAQKKEESGDDIS